MVSFERSALEPLSQTPVMSGCPSSIGGGVAPVYHQAPTLGTSFLTCASADSVEKLKNTNAPAIVRIEIRERFILNLRSGITLWIDAVGLFVRRSSLSIVFLQRIRTVIH